MAIFSWWRKKPPAKVLKLARKLAGVSLRATVVRKPGPRKAFLQKVLDGVLSAGGLVAPVPGPGTGVTCLVERDGDIIRDRAGGPVVVALRNDTTRQSLQERDGDILLDRDGNQILMRAA